LNDPGALGPTRGKILLTGATGYVGGRLRKELESRGIPVRCLARSPERLAGRVDPLTEIVRGDVSVPETIEGAMEGIDTAFYLVHSMGLDGDFEGTDRKGAQHFADAARRHGLRRIVYLGGLGEPGEDLSPHLRSRHEVGKILRSSGIPVIELRASIVLGSGSLSFEMIRALVERLPVMVTPRWVEVLAQPIGIEDVVRYLVEAVDIPVEGSRIFEIGGPDKLSYGALMREYARQRGLRRFMIRVPVLTPRLSSLWLGLVTPLYARVGRKLIESIRHPTVVRDPSAAQLFSIHPMSVAESIARALREDDRETAKTHWYDAFSSAGEPSSWAGVRFGNRFVDSRTVTVPVSPSRAFGPIRRIGGRNGWYAFSWLWKLRGFVDLLIGGVGVRRGRPHPDHLGVGDALDFWRVEEFEPDRRLRLCAEMKLPGRAWLEFEVGGSGATSTIRQTAIFDPVGLGGLAYWYLIYPLHALVFAGMLKGIAKRAVLPDDGSPTRA
jgi:uncharacterized protein YbjT (DUF2867 family)